MKNLIRAFVLLFVLVQLCRAQVSFVKNGQQIPPVAGWSVDVADFNEDGNLDVVFSPDDILYLYFGDGKGQFTNSNITLPSGLAIGDVNHDDHLDIIGGSKIWLNDGTGNFTSIDGITGNIDGIKLADLNGDGHPDIFAVVDFSASRVFFNDGAGNFTDSGQKLGDGTIGTGQIGDLTLGDINNDGAIDAITAGWRWNGSTESPNQVWINDGKGNFTLGTQNLDEGSSHVHGLAMHDLNGDGWLDLILVIQDANRCGRVYLNDGTGNLIKKGNILGYSGEDVEFGDFNGDGIMDVFVAQSQGGSRVWLNNGQGNLTYGGVRLGSTNYWDTAVGDFNNDGKPDIFAVGFIWGSGAAAPVDIWLNTTVTTDVKTGSNSIPENYQLFQNYPNPFNPSTTINFMIPVVDAPSNVEVPITLKVYDTLGREIATLVNGYKSPGNYEVEFDASTLSSGVYFYQMKTYNQIHQKKMILVR